MKQATTTCDICGEEIKESTYLYSTTYVYVQGSNEMHDCGYERDKSNLGILKGFAEKHARKILTDNYGDVCDECIKIYAGKLFNDILNIREGRGVK